MVGGFLRSTLYQILHCGFFAFVSVMVLFYVLFLKCNLPAFIFTYYIAIFLVFLDAKFFIMYKSICLAISHSMASIARLLSLS